MNKIFIIIAHTYLLSATILYTSEKPHVSFGISDNGNPQTTIIGIPRVKFSKQLWWSKKEQKKCESLLYAVIEEIAAQPPYNGTITSEDLNVLDEKATDILNEREENCIAGRVIKRRKFDKS